MTVRPSPSSRPTVAGPSWPRAGETAARAWWRRVPRVLTAPRSVFAALAETDDLDVDARAEPVLAIVIVAGMASILLTPAWGTVMDDGTVDGLVLVVLTFLGGVFYGAAGYFLLGLALWLGAKGVGVEAPFRIARQVVAFAAVPIALSAVVTRADDRLSLRVGLVSDDRQRHRTGRDAVIAIGLAFAVWSLVLVGLALRTTFRLPWRGVVGALALAGVMVAAFAVLPTAL